MAIGLVGRKCGMTRIFTAAGESVPVTVVEVLPTSASWFGITYRPDRPRVAAAISALVQAGQYPPRLF